MRTLVLAQCLLLAGSMCAGAQEYRLMGFGVASCGKWVSSIDDPMTHIGYLSWMLGYVSGTNTSAIRRGQWHFDEELRKTDGDAMDRWMTNYCKANPLKQISEGVDALLSEISK